MWEVRVPTGEQVGGRRGGGEDDRHRDPEGPLGQDPPGRPEPVDRQRQRPDGDLRPPGHERQQQSEGHERRLDQQSAHDTAGSEPREGDHHADRDGIEHEGRHRRPRRGDHPEDEREGAGELHLGWQRHDRPGGTGPIGAARRRRGDRGGHGASAHRRARGGMGGISWRRRLDTGGQPGGLAAASAGALLRTAPGRQPDDAAVNPAASTNTSTTPAPRQAQVE